MYVTSNKNKNSTTRPVRQIAHKLPRIKNWEKYYQHYQEKHHKILLKNTQKLLKK